MYYSQMEKKREKTMEKQKVKENMRPLFRIIFSQVFCTAIVMIVTGLAVVTVILSQYILDQLGQNRLDVLSQIASQNKVIKSVSAHVTDELVDRIQLRYVQGEPLSDVIQSELEKTQQLFNQYEMNTTIDIVITNTKERFSTSREDKQEPLKQLTSSYWYLNLVSGENDKVWNLRLLDIEDAASSVLSYGRVMWDKGGKVACVIMTNTSQRMLYDSYGSLVDQDNIIYIVDQNGVFISHTNPGLVGFSMYHMASRQEQLHQNSTKVVKKRNGSYLVSQYYDPETGWTIIEEMKTNLIFLNYKDIVLRVSGIIFLFVMLAVLVSYVTSKKISQPLMALEKRMEQVRQDNLEEIVTQDAYLEVYRLSLTFNEMLARIRQLIDDIKTQEKEKNAIEFDFLQAQINPHFLHNTLLGIKTLVLTGKNDRAQDMIAALIAILKNPIYAERDLCPLREEISYVCQYVTLMEYRYGRTFNLTCYIAPELEDFLVPPMILQPLAENAIFHGLSMLEEEAFLSVSAFYSQGKIVLQVDDNGDGMTPQQLENIWNASDHSRGLNGISMKNVRSRIRYTYGANSDIRVESELHHGTTVRIFISQEQEGER